MQRLHGRRILPSRRRTLMSDRTLLKQDARPGSQSPVTALLSHAGHATTVQCWHILEQDWQRCCEQLHHRRRWLLCHHRLNRADGVRQGHIHCRVNLTQGQMHNLCWRLVPRQRRCDSVCRVRRRLVLPRRRGGAAALQPGQLLECH